MRSELEFKGWGLGSPGMSPRTAQGGRTLHTHCSTPGNALAGQSPPKAKACASVLASSSHTQPHKVPQHWLAASPAPSTTRTGRARAAFLRHKQVHGDSERITLAPRQQGEGLAHLVKGDHALLWAVTWSALPWSRAELLGHKGDSATMPRAESEHTGNTAPTRGTGVISACTPGASSHVHRGNNQAPHPLS